MAGFGESISIDDIKGLQRQIVRTLWLKGRPPIEGSTSAEELQYLATLVRRTGAKRIGEIGFNASFSTQTFLSASPDTTVVSFDLLARGYTKVAKKLVDEKFPGRHTLIGGDSTKTVPDFAAKNPDLKFDLVFIDGGHSYEVAMADILNMRKLCTAESAVVIDDLTPWLKWGKGPTKAWNEAIEQGLVRQDELYNEGKPVSVPEPPGKRVWALGHYLYNGDA